ncbi:HNH endonuclease [Symmachiella dynata]|uniref:HNH endonuclease n=1 Tax=Symmachiella dynata TaxID=2527995 RepID=UPI0011891750|nr:HNH endonuclease [Symmachiella dynata]QDT46198.1 HNH endonuclease [Symmachiella dynata]
MAKKGSKKKIIELFLQNVGLEIPRERIHEAAGVMEWARRVRELAQEGWEIETTPKGYILRSDEKREVDAVRINISAKVRYRILKRDNSLCRRCGKTVDDGVKLVVDHIIPVEWGGQTEEGNLWTLCEECNLGKKDHESDVDAAAMKKIMALSAAKDRLREYFRHKPNETITREEVQIVSGISEYARRIRELRNDERMDITVANARGDYIFRPANDAE